MKLQITCVMLLLLIALGCQSKKPTSTGGDGTTPVVENGTNNSSNTGNKGSGSGDTGAQVVTPTIDDSVERKQARDMDVPALVNALSDAKLADAASDELKSRGNASVEPLIAALASKDETVKQKAIFTLGQLGPEAKAALPKLKTIAESKDSELLASSAEHAIDSIEGK
jgi:hypothetical protein